jgi:hypothetical protein
MSQLLTIQDFVAYLGKKITPKGQHRALTLVSVDTSVARGSDGGTQEPFTLITCGPRDDLLPEELYDVAIANGPDFTMATLNNHRFSRALLRSSSPGQAR